jgi:cell division protein FtsB
MVDILNTFVAIILSVVALTPIFLLVILLNRFKVKTGADPAMIQKLEDMDATIASDTNAALDQVSAKLEDFEARIADLEDARVNIKGFKK